LQRPSLGWPGLCLLARLLTLQAFLEPTYGWTQSPSRASATEQIILRLVGLLAPYETPARVYHPPLGEFTVVIRRGAFDAIVGQRPAVWICHDRKRRIDAGCELLVNHAGLYGVIALPERSMQLEVVRYARLCGNRGSRVRASIRIGDCESYWLPPPSRLETITRVTSLLEVSLIAAPAYRSTWLAWDGDDARRRIAAENIASRERELNQMRTAAC